jgi:type VI secretion system protein
MIFPFILLGATFLSGCQFFTDVSHDPEVRLQSVSLLLDHDANMRSATSVDIILVYSKELKDTLLQMNSQNYYKCAEQIRRDYPELVDVWHWELTPGQVIRYYPIRQRPGPVQGAFIFADYMTSGNHRIRLGSQVHSTIRLRREDFCVSEQGCASPKKSFPYNPLEKTPIFTQYHGSGNRVDDNPVHKNRRFLSELNNHKSYGSIEKYSMENSQKNQTFSSLKRIQNIQNQVKKLPSQFSSIQEDVERNFSIKNK